MKRFRYLTLTILTAGLLWLHQSTLWAMPFGLPSEGAAATQEAPAIAPAKEIRGVWLTNVDSDVLFSRTKVDHTLQQLADYHFNTVYPAVWSWGYTLFPSHVAERAIGYKQGLYPDFDDTGRDEALENAQGDRDALLEVVTLAHARHLSVIPWFEFGFMAPAASPASPASPRLADAKTRRFAGGTPLSRRRPYPRVAQSVSSRGAAISAGVGRRTHGELCS